jgi:hypothetical protein
LSRSGDYKKAGELSFQLSFFPASRAGKSSLWLAAMAAAAAPTDTGVIEVTVLLQPDTRHVLNIEVGATVSALRRTLRTHTLRDVVGRRNIVLVAAGRVMQDSDLISTFSMAGVGSLVVHCMLTDAPAATTTGDSSLRGFDRLRLLGLEEQQVALFRQLYLMQAVEEVGEAVPLEVGEEEASRLLRIEEHWIVRQRADSEFSLNLRAALSGEQGAGGGAARPNPWLSGGWPRGAPEVTEEDDRGGAGDGGSGGGSTWHLFLLGVVVGYFVGVFAVACLCNASLSQKFKIGIWVGVLINALMYTFFAPEAKGDTDGPPAPTGMAAEPQPRTPDFPPRPLVPYVPNS